MQKAFADKDRGALLEAAGGSFAVLKEKYGVSSENFYFSPAETFLRVNRPKDFGDDVSSYRKLVVESNSEKAVRKGLEITSTGVSIAGTAPIKDEQGTHIGVVDVDLDVGALLDDLKKAHGFELALFVNEDLLRNTAKAMKQDVFSDQNRVGSYIKYFSTHPDLLQTLVTDGELNVTEDSFLVRDSAGIPYGVLRQPIYNFSKQPIGFLVVAKDFGETRAEDGQAVVMQALLGGTSVVLLIGVVLVVIRGLILRPMAALTTHVAALADQDAVSPTPPTPPTAGWCDEMKLLQSECDRLSHTSHSKQESPR